MKQVRRITESQINKLVRKVLSEENPMMEPSTSNMTPQTITTCSEKMTKPQKGMVGGSSFLKLPTTGEITLVEKNTVSPEYQGTYVNIGKMPFCFIPRHPR